MNNMEIPHKENSITLYRRLHCHFNCEVYIEDKQIYTRNKLNGEIICLSSHIEWFDFYKQLIED